MFESNCHSVVPAHALFLGRIQPLHLGKNLGDRPAWLTLVQGANLRAHSHEFFTRFCPLCFWQRLGPLLHHFRQAFWADFLKAADFPFGQVVGNRPQRHHVVQVPEETGQPTALAVSDLLMDACAGVAEGVQAFVGRVVGALQVLRVLDGFEVVDFVFHVATDRFPVADGQGQADAGEFDAGQGLAVLETDAHAVLAVDAVLGDALGFDDPGGEGFPRDEDGRRGTLGHEADFAALAVEAGGDDAEAFIVVVLPGG